MQKKSLAKFSKEKNQVLLLVRNFQNECSSFKDIYLEGEGL